MMKNKSSCEKGGGDKRMRNKNTYIVKDYPTPPELVRMFMAKGVVKTNIKEKKKEKREILLEFKQDLERTRGHSQRETEILILADTSEMKLKRIDKELIRLYSYLSDEVECKIRISSQQIEQAKQIPILDVFTSLYDGTIRKIGKNYVCICPFHEEQHPSFYIYSDTNRFYCFGCGKSGDVITLVMELLNLSFPKAVDYLIGGKK